MSFVVVDALDSARAVVQRLHAAGEPVVALWTPACHDNAARQELAASCPGLVQHDWSRAAEHELLNRLGDRVALADSYPGLRWVTRWNDRVLARKGRDAAVGAERWLDKLVFDLLLRQRLPQLALGVEPLPRRGPLPAGHLVRKRVSRGDGSACWPEVLAEQPDFQRESYCSHPFQPGQSFFCNGVHFADGIAVTDTWRCLDKAFGVRHLLCGVSPLLPASADHAQIVEAVAQAADALALPPGPFHAEGVLCAGAGIRLLKLLPKLGGFPLPALCARMGCADQPTVTAQGWLSNFAARPVLAQPTRFASDFSFPIGRDGRVQALNGIEQLEDMPSFSQYLHRCRPGDLVSATVDELARPIVMLLEHDDPMQLERDVESCVRRLEQGIYVLE
ncbi:MAG TPA: hypothetical protein VFP68_07410 [Burkholderiaceae bacterium]|nr:hypothetical protein [Burkholderiaceae bacterium]